MGSLTHLTFLTLLYGAVASCANDRDILMISLEAVAARSPPAASSAGSSQTGRIAPIPG
jgi:hypothetical protein